MSSVEPTRSLPGGPTFSAPMAATRIGTETTRGPGQAERLNARYRRGLAVADVISAAGATALLHLVEGVRVVQVDLAAGALIVVVAKLLGRYDCDHVTIRRSTLDEVPALVTLAALMGVLWSLAAMPLGVTSNLSGGGVGLLWLLLTALLITVRAGVRALAGRLSGPERVLIVGSAKARQAVAHSLSTDPGARIQVVGYLPFEDERGRDLGPPAQVGRDRRRRDWSFDDLPRIARWLSVDRVVLVPTGADSELMLDAVRRTNQLGLRVSLIPRLFEVIGSAVEFDSVGGVTMLGLREPGLARSSRSIKRAVDLTGAGLVCTLLAPVLLFAAAAIKLDSPGPVFFRQRRIGRDGQAFEMLKFRSMVDGADNQRAALADRNETEGLFKLEADPRVTRVGRILRRCSIDELPQLLNVLKGEMSLVGPRPLVPAEDALVVGRHRERLALAPGMTGPWQVLGPTRPPLAEMVKTDYLYAITWTLWLDLKIMLRTVAHVRAGRGR